MFEWLFGRKPKEFGYNKPQPSAPAQPPAASPESTDPGFQPWGDTPPTVDDAQTAGLSVSWEFGVFFLDDTQARPLADLSPQAQAWLRTNPDRYQALNLLSDFDYNLELEVAMCNMPGMTGLISLGRLEATARTLLDRGLADETVDLIALDTFTLVWELELLQHEAGVLTFAELTPTAQAALQSWKNSGTF
jgi:hypothetical protein